VSLHSRFTANCPTLPFLPLFRPLNALETAIGIEPMNKGFAVLTSSSSEFSRLLTAGFS
jgi:hypothetical protein